MDILKRNLAPLTDTAWNEIDSRAKEVLKTHLSARKVVNIDGPKGWDYNFVSEGRLTSIQGQEGDVMTGLYMAKPLVESRIIFELDRWEFDNITRGSKDIDFSALENAVEKIALFEESSIYNGLERAGIEGLTTVKNNQYLEFGKNAGSIMENIAAGMVELQKSYVSLPYTLVVGQEAWKRINAEVQGESLIIRIKTLLKSDIVYSHILEGALLLPKNNKNFDMTIGQDFSIGYEDHTTKKVRLFITESFTFRILDKNIIINYKM